MGVDDRFVGKGVIVELSSDGGTNYNAVESVRNVTPVGEDNATIDVTALTDPQSESQPGLPQLTSLTYQDYPNYNSTTTEEDIRQIQADGTLIDLRATWVNAAGTLVMTMQGYVTTHSYPTVDGTSALLRDVTVIKKGAVTWTFTPSGP